MKTNHSSSLMIVGRVFTVDRKLDRNGKPYISYAIVVEKPVEVDGLVTTLREYYNGAKFNADMVVAQDGRPLETGQLVKIEGGVRARGWVYNGKVHTSLDIFPRSIQILSENDG